MCSYLGLQDAARKRREPSQEPGAWAGSVVSTQGGQVCKSVTQERWDKLKTRVRWLAGQAGSKFHCKEGESDGQKEAAEI
mmetsp:Transcript_11543/g.17733  ORF Transcript_11543/g.17733 Transcript_11543/m.17733 type:complete len:80 (+) Transcript_11543:2996-3235(+)